MRTDMRTMGQEQDNRNNLTNYQDLDKEGNNLNPQVQCGKTPVTMNFSEHVLRGYNIHGVSKRLALCDLTGDLEQYHKQIKMSPKNGDVSSDKMLIKPSSQDKEAIFKMASSLKYFMDIEKQLQIFDFNVNMECDKNGDFLQHIAVRNGMTYLPLLMTLVKYQGADIELCNAEGMTSLMLAAAAGNYVLCDVLICLLEADPNKPNTQTGRSALHYAAEGKHGKTVECLINRGADVNMEDHDGLRADDILTSGSDDCKEIIAFHRLKRMEMLSDMVRKSEILPSQLLLSDLCVVDNDGQTIVMIAAAYNKFTHLQNLLRVSSSTMNAQHCKTGMTALAISARLGNLEAVQVLLRDKACPMIADIEGHLPLHHAVISSHENVVDIFLDYFPELYVGLYKAIHLCSKSSIRAKLKLAWLKRQERIVAPKLLECAVSGKAEELFQLLEEGDNINQKGLTGVWPMYAAVENGHLEVLQLLYENGGDITKQHPANKATLLHVAARMGHLNIVVYLLQFCKNSQKNFPGSSHFRQSSKSDECHEGSKSFLDINTVDRDNKTPLQLAAEKGFSQIVHLLLSHGATTSILNSDGELLKCPYFEGIQVAIETHRQQHTLQIMESIEEKSEKALSVLQETWLPRFDHHLRNKEGSTPLMVAAKTGNTQVIQFLLKSALYSDEVQVESERGSNVNSDSDTDSGVIDLTTGSPQDFTYNDDEFEISLDRITSSHDLYLHYETQHDYWRSEHQVHNSAVINCSEHNQRRLTSLTSHVSRQKSQSIYHGGLVSHLCAVNLKDGNNVLHYAIHNSDAPHILALLLECDPTPLNMQNDRGETVLHLACRLGRKKSLQLLLERPDLHLNIRTCQGHLPEQVAESQTIQKMVEKARASSASLIHRNASL